MQRATELAHYLIRPSIKPGDWTVDATAGNGHDTLFLAQCVGPSGRVFGFDIQETALAATTEHVRGHPQVTLLHDGHEHMNNYLPDEMRGKLAAVMFNLGYLPGAEKHVTTRTETTLAALAQAIENIRVSGVVSIVVYPGHTGGAEEACAVEEYAASLPPAFAAGYHSRLNAPQSAPRLLLIERLR